MHDRHQSRLTSTPSSVSLETYRTIVRRAGVQLPGETWIKSNQRRSNSFSRGFNSGLDRHFNNNLTGASYRLGFSPAARNSSGNLAWNSQPPSNQSPFSRCCVAVTCHAYARILREYVVGRRAPHRSPDTFLRLLVPADTYAARREAGLIKRAPSSLDGLGLFQSPASVRPSCWNLFASFFFERVLLLVLR